MSRQLEISGINQEAIQKEKIDWNNLDALMSGDFPRKQEYERVSAKAKKVLDVMALALGTPNGYTAIEKGVEQLKELYSTAVDIRSQVGLRNIQATLQVSPGQSIDTVLEKRIEEATPPLGEQNARDVNQYLTSLANAFAINPADTLTRNVPGNIFYRPGMGVVMVNTDVTKEHRTKLQNLRKTCNGRPDLGNLAHIIDTFLRSLDATEKVDTNPQRAAYQKWHDETFAGKRVDWTPLIKATGIVGALITTFGLGQAAYLKKLSPATVGWAAATWLLATRGSVFKNSSSNTIERLAATTEVSATNTQLNELGLTQFAALGSRETDAVVRAGFRGALGKKAFEELQEIAENKDKAALLRRLLSSSQPISIADLGALTEDTKGPLLKILSQRNVSDAMRRTILKTFGGKFSKADQEYVGEMLMARV